MVELGAFFTAVGLEPQTIGTAAAASKSVRPAKLLNPEELNAAAKIIVQVSREAKRLRADLTGAF